MNIEIDELLSPGPCESSFRKIEDSGYHTSYTPGSFGCSSFVHENSDITFGSNLKRRNEELCSLDGPLSELNYRHVRKHRKINDITVTGHSYLDSPVARRGLKRSYQEDTDTRYGSITTASTPTSIIAGKIQSLNVNDSFEAECPPTLKEFSELSSGDYSFTSYPTTPIKKICRKSNELSPTACHGNQCNSSPLRVTSNLSCLLRRSGKKLNFTNHSLSGETVPVHENRHRVPSKAARSIFRPQQKIDLITMLYQKVHCGPVITKIFSYLSTQDIYNFSLVSPTWHQVCEVVSKAKSKKEEYEEFITNTKENHENRHNNKVKESCVKSETQQKQTGNSLRDIQNIVNLRFVKNSPMKSPPTTPKTRKFRTFVKSASLDSRLQLSCVRCCHPAKVNSETSGEEWAECKNISCSYQFCRFCKCERHPGKICFKYDLDGPSPSKRKRKTSTAGTKKSKKNLRRLLE